MEAIEEVVEKLKERYGVEHDYSAMSKEQIRLLGFEAISGFTDVVGNKTLAVEGLEDGVLSLIDTYNYGLRQGHVSNSGYAREKIPVYTLISRDKNPEKITEDTFMFKLKDESKVKVQFVAVKGVEQ